MKLFRRGVHSYWIFVTRTWNFYWTKPTCVIRISSNPDRLLTIHPLCLPSDVKCGICTWEIASALLVFLQIQFFSIKHFMRLGTYFVLVFVNLFKPYSSCAEKKHVHSPSEERSNHEVLFVRSWTTIIIFTYASMHIQQLPRGQPSRHEEKHKRPIHLLTASGATYNVNLHRLLHTIPCSSTVISLALNKYRDTK